MMGTNVQSNIVDMDETKISAQSINNTPIDQALSDFQVPLEKFLEKEKDTFDKEMEMFNNGQMSIADSAYF